MKIIVIGAGIFGTSAAIELSKDHDVTLVESNSDIMMNASKCNHNRLHYGFHYPRSKDTAIQSLNGYELFYKIFKNSIISNFPNYYMIDKTSKINSNEYLNFCKILNLFTKEEYPSIDMNFSSIESSFLTNEPIFDYDSIKETILLMLKKTNVKIILNKKITNKKELDDYDVVVNTTYANINYINNIFNIQNVKLKMQTVVIPIFSMKQSKIGLTIMDGNYCSIVPKGFEKNKFLLYHVKNSVVEQAENYLHSDKLFNIQDIHIKNIYNESEKYFTFLKNCKHIGYWSTVRALPINTDDSRLTDISYIEIDNKKIISVLSGKITTCWLIAKNIKKMI
jgi:D-amino-acid oxidase